MPSVYFISHPEVVIDPNVPVPNWPLSERGLERMQLMLGHPWINNLCAVYSSQEQKAIDGAMVIAKHLALQLAQYEDLGEMDRSSTGYLSQEEFQEVANQFFANPGESVRGWEVASDAQKRIVGVVKKIAERHSANDSIAIVSHGGVGALLLCDLAKLEIAREHDQPGAGGGNYFLFEPETWSLQHGWRPIEQA